MTQASPPAGSKPAPAESSLSKKPWRVGTLTYTTFGLAVLFCWLLWGDFAWQMRDRSVPAIMQLLLKKYGASDMVAGLLIGSLPGLISMFLSPVISYNSDRHRGRWGRRIPFLLIPTPIIVISIVGLAISPWLGGSLHAILGGSSPGVNLLVLISLGLFWTVFEFACTSANAVFGGLVNDVVPESVVGRFFGLFRSLSLIAGIMFNFWLFGRAETDYVWIFLGIGLLYGVGFTVMCLNVKEGEYPPPPQFEEKRRAGFLDGCKTYFRECFTNSYYLWFFVAIAVASLAFNPVNLFSVFYAKSIDMSMADYGKCMGITYTISLVLAFPLGMLADRFHPLRLSMVALGLYGAVCLWGGFYAHNAWNFGIALIAHGVASGMFMTASASITQRLLPRSRFTEFCSATSIICCLANVAIAPIMGMFLDYTHHVYRYTFYAGAGLSVLALLTFLILYRKFMALGGPGHYVAPE